MGLTAVHLRALEASAEAAAMSAQALIMEIRSLRAALSQQIETAPAMDLPKVCPHCGAGMDLHLATSDGRIACRKCSTIF